MGEKAGARSFETIAKNNTVAFLDFFKEAYYLSDQHL